VLVLAAPPRAALCPLPLHDALPIWSWCRRHLEWGGSTWSAGGRATVPSGWDVSARQRTVPSSSGPARCTADWRSWRSSDEPPLPPRQAVSTIACGLRVGELDHPGHRLQHIRGHLPDRGRRVGDAAGDHVLVDALVVTDNSLP